MRHAALGAVAVLALAGCSRKQTSGRSCAPRDEVRIALAVSPNTLDWSRSSDSSWGNYPVMHAIMRGLTTLDEKHQPVPDLAERWDVTTTQDDPPHQVYTFHLRTNVTWSDGKTPLTAQDFVVGWRRALGGNDKNELADLVGASDVVTAGSDAVKLSAAYQKLGVEAVDDHTLRVTLVSPRSYFLERVALVYPFFPVPSAELKGKGEEEIGRYFNEPAGGKPMTLGAFQVDRWDRAGDTIVLTPNPTAGDQPNALKRLVLMHADLASVLYDKCEIDVYMMDDPSLLRTPPPDTVRVPLLSTYWLGINAQKPYLNLALRHAISHAIDREKAVAGLVPVTRPAFGLLPPDLPGAVAPGDPLAKDFPTFDMAAAKQEVAASGYDGRELTLLVSSGNSFLPEPGIAEAIRGQLATVGVKVRVVPSANLNDDAKLMQHDLLLKRTGADYAHPETFMSVWKRGGHNFTSWDQLDGGAGIDKLMQLTDQGAVELDPAAMRPIYVQAQKLLLVDDAVVVPIYYPDRYFRKRPWVAGLEINPFNFFTMRTLHLATTEPSH